MKTERHDKLSLFTRREMLRLGAASVLALGLPSRALFGKNETDCSETNHAGEFTFVVANDLHFRDERCRPWLEAVARAMQRHKPDFCVLNGDLSENGNAVQLASVREIFASINAPVHVTIGNHDYATDADREAFEEIFPNSLNYTFTHKNWQFVALDSTQGQRVFYTRVQQPALSWLDETLPRLDKNKPTVLFTHFPLGARVLCRPLNAPMVAQRFQNYNLRGVFNGHWHGYSLRESGVAKIVTGRCCSSWRKNNDGSKDKGFFLCRTKSDGKIIREFCVIKSVSSVTQMS